MEFSSRLKNVIKKTGLKREDFAERTGVSRRQLFNYLDNSSEPTLSFFQKIKLEFPWVDLEWLTTGNAINCTQDPVDRDPQIREVVSIMERLDDKAKADIIRVAEKEELISDVKKMRGLKPIGEAGIVGVNFLIQLLLPTEIILAGVGLGWISGAAAWNLLHLNIYYWAAAIATAIVLPVQTIRWLKRRESSIIVFNSRHFGNW